MAIFKCKICGGTLEIDSTKSVATCEYCGTKQTLPKLDDDRKANLYDRANHFRRNNDFDKAMGIYENILNEDNTDSEAYWSIVLCRYGIEYVEDPTTHKHLPTVNRAQFTSIFDDEDYKSAIANADEYQREIYESEANAINEIQKGFLAISHKEEPFDVFICYKETDNNGRRTQDSVLATELYNELTREGFKVFFSRITLEDKLGVAYEPYIFAALHSAKVMVVLGTRPENFNAVWVKNEWSRFLALIKNGAKKTLIPAYRDMDPYDLPEEFSHLQAQDMSKLGFMQDLTRGIRKIVTADAPKKTVVAETVIAGGSAGSEPLFRRASMALEDGEFERADAFYEQILNQEPENAEAYVGKLLAELHLKKVSELTNSAVSFEGSSNYKKALQFANAELKTELSNALQNVLVRIDNKKKEQIYQNAKVLLNGARDIPTCQTACKLFFSISDYQDAAQHANECQGKIQDFQKEWEQLRLAQRKKEEERRIVAKKTKKGICIAVSGICLLSVLIMSFVFYYRVIIPNRKYNEAINLLEQEKFQDAIVAFESLEGYKDSQSKIDDCKNALLDIEYNKALELLNQKKYQDAISAFESLEGYKDSQSKIDDCKNALLDIEYNKALELLNQKKYQDAISAFESLNGYKDSQSKIDDCKNALLDIEYNKAMKLLNEKKYQDAISAFESLNGYKDSQSKIDDCKNALLDIEYNKAMKLLNEKKYQDAISAFESLNGYKDSQSKIDDCKNALLDIEYNKAMKLLNEKKYLEAIRAFETIIEYRDSKEQIKKCNIAMVNIGDIYTFGNYHGSTEWIVLDKVGSKILIISKDCLDFQRYGSQGTWESSEIREWLNSDFIAEAFDASEQKRIISTNLSTPDNTEYGSDGGNDTVDKVFFLSIEEAKRYFSSNATRIALMTEYAIKQGGFSQQYGTQKATWWLRSPGYNDRFVACVTYTGEIYTFGNWAYYKDEPSSLGETIRPAMWIDLNV